jgi:hypothetical protein
MASLIKQSVFSNPDEPEDITVSQNMPDPASTLLFRIERVEQEITQLKAQEIAQLKAQLNLYVPVREYELRLQSIMAGIGRIEQDIKDFKDQVAGLAVKLQEQKEGQDKLLIRILWGGFSLLIGIGGAVLIGFITHYFH